MLRKKSKSKNRPPEIDFENLCLLPPKRCFTKIAVEGLIFIFLIFKNGQVASTGSKIEMANVFPLGFHSLLYASNAPMK